MTSDAWCAQTSSDPCLRETCLERVSGPDHTVSLVGVVHDHPASVYRVQTVVDQVSPAVLALELPPLAVPLVAHHASDKLEPPTFGGEMSAAIQAADTDRLVGIDGPATGFFTQLAADLYRHRASFDTVCNTARKARAVTRRAITHRLAAAVATLTTLPLLVDAPTTYDTGRTDDPARQAADERRQITRANSFLEAFSIPPATRIHRSAREQFMAQRLATLRREGDVVAVVGMGHLSAVADHLRTVE